MFKYSKPILSERLSALLHDLGKANYADKCNMSGHADESVEYAKGFLKRMKYSSAMINKVLTIVKCICLIQMKKDGTRKDAFYSRKL